MSTIQPLTSLANPLIKQVIKLHSTKGRKEYKKFLAEGVRIISTLAEKMQPLHLFITERTRSWAQEHFSTTPTWLVSELVMKKISQSTSPCDAVALFAIPATPALDTLGEGIILYNLQDPGNVGTLIRTAAAMNKKSVVCIEGVDPWNFKVVQATAGTIAHVDLFDITWQELQQHKNNLRIIALVVQGGKKAECINFSQALLMIGNEGSGLPAEAIAQSNELMTLAMPGGTESLNAAIAGSIALYLAWGNH